MEAGAEGEVVAEAEVADQGEEADAEAGGEG